MSAFREILARLKGRKGTSERIDPQSQPGIRSSKLTPPTSLRRERDGGAISEIPSPSAHQLSVSNVGGGRPANTPTAAYQNNSIVHASIIDVLKRPSDAYTPLKSVAEGLTAVLKYYHQPMANRKRIESLVLRVEGLAGRLGVPAREGDIKEIRRRQLLRRKLEKHLRYLVLLEERGKVTGFLDSVGNVEALTDLAEGIRDAVMGYQASLQQDAYDRNIQLADKVDLSLLKGMRHTPDAGFSSGNRKGCLRGTRKAVLLELEQWLMDEKEKRVFWLSGPVGIGKSSIAQAFAETSFFDGKLGASFFCSRNSADKSDLQLIFPTLAFQLAHQYPRFREQLLQVLGKNPDVGQASLCSQLEKLIAHPLKATQISTLIIIDALDECKDGEPTSTLLSALSCYVHEIPEVKFFITCRSGPPIQEELRLESLHPLMNVLNLHNADRSLEDEDIRLYLRTNLTDIPKRITHDDFPEEWPTPYDIDILCKKAAGLFIYASKVINFVASRIHNPTKRLDRIILHPRDAVHERELDFLYTQILELAFHDVDSSQPELYLHFKHIVGAALLVFRPLSRKALSDLLGNCKTPSHIFTTLHPLHPLLDVPDSEDDPIRVFHESFPDFLVNPMRCEDERFFVDPSVHHRDILFSCLELMKERLKRNICDLDDYAVLSEVEELSARRETYIGSSLEYACRFWTRHLARVSGTGPHVERVHGAIDEFFSTCLFFWIEVLSVVGCLGTAVYATNDIRQWYISAGITTSKQVDDIERLILEYFNGIHDSPSHVYHSALPLLPSSSWLRECYEAELAQEVRVVSRLPDRWDACSRRISIQGEPSAFAHWGDIIGVGVGSSTVVLLDTITGSNKSALSGHTGIILSLAFSLDGTLLVSGSEDKTVKLWDVQTGAAVKTFSDHTSSILAVSISSDHATIASGAEDGTICLWDVRTGRCHPMPLCHDGRVTAVSFSPIDSRRLISSSWDRTVRWWNVDGRQVGATCHEAGRVAYVSYASDGTHFVLCGGTVATVRDSESGAVMVKLYAPKRQPLLQCCFSPDDKFVACVATDTIYVWDITSSEARLVGNFVGHSKPIISIAFSSFLISASQDRSVKIWQSSNFRVDPITADNTPTLLDSAQIESVHLFAEENTVVTSDSSGVVKVWDLATGGCESPFSTPAKGIQDTQLAGDPPIVVWWAVDGKEYRVWDVGNDQLLRTIPSSLDEILDLRISGDGSKIFGLGVKHIEARSIQAGGYASCVELQEDTGKEGGLVVRGSKVWLAGSKETGWDFGGQEVSHFSLSRGFPDRPRFDLVEPPVDRMAKSARVQDTVTGRVVFYLPERYMEHGTRRRLDGRHLLVWSRSGEVTVIDLNCVPDTSS